MKKFFITLSVAVVSLLASDQYVLGVGAGRNDVQNSGIENYNFLNLRAGKYLKKNHILRFEFEKSENILNGQNLKRALVNIERCFENGNKITPYVFAGLGYQWIGGNLYSDETVADFGIGADYNINKNLNAFLECRGLRDFGNNDNHYGFIFGISYSFGKKTSFQKRASFTFSDTDGDGVNDKSDRCQNTPESVKVDANGCPADGDRDGVADYRDKCPQTPFGVEIDKRGCPVDSDKDGVYNGFDKCPDTPRNVKTDTNGCAVDSEKDGIADYMDRCPVTPTGVQADKRGCPVDSDKDGVPDYMDRCPQTPVGIGVNSKGCPVSFNFGIEFDNNSAEIKREFMATIIEFAAFLKNNPYYKARIEGYTDNKGSAVYNRRLSEKRAKAVYEALIKLGIDKNRLSYKGYGEGKPVASNATAEGKARNRRVVARIYY
ncbi:OmpA family protein [Nautilia sp.]